MNEKVEIGLTITKKIDKRKAYFKKLLKGQPGFYVWWPGWKEKFKRWLWVDSFDEQMIESLSRDVHFSRSKLSTELVFDIDAPEWNFAAKTVKELSSYLSKIGIPHHLWFSGNKGFHIHVFLDVWDLAQHPYPSPFIVMLQHYLKFKPSPNLEVRNGRIYSNEKGFEELLEFKQTVFTSLGRLIVSKLPTELKNFVDMHLMGKHLIRAEGSQHPKTNAYKTYLERIPDEKPVIRQFSEVSFPTHIEFWRPSPQEFWEMMAKAYYYFVRPEILQRVSRRPSGRNTKPLKWIEKLLKTPIQDGRKRMIQLVLAPYLVNVKGLSVDKATEMILDWLSECRKLEIFKINGRAISRDQARKYVEYYCLRVSKTRLRPMSWKKAIVMLPCLRVLGGNRLRR